jgi:hypothetical protein
MLQAGRSQVRIAIGSLYFTLGHWVCLIKLHGITCYIYSSYMYNTYIRPPLVQARTADYTLSRVDQVATAV